jgi:hypothetical protein
MEKNCRFQSDFKELWMTCQHREATIEIIFFFPKAPANLFEIMRWQCTFVRFV